MNRLCIAADVGGEPGSCLQDCTAGDRCKPWAEVDDPFNLAALVEAHDDRGDEQTLGVGAAGRRTELSHLELREYIAFALGVERVGATPDRSRRSFAAAGRNVAFLA